MGNTSASQETSSPFLLHFLPVFPYQAYLYGVGIGKGVVAAKRADCKIHGVEHFVYEYRYAALL
jgi:hypothetical protein